jgi:hypothetical protein
MDSVQAEFMSRRHSPGRLTAEQVRWRLGMTRDEVRIISSEEIVLEVRGSLPKKDQVGVLSSKDLLHYLGHPSQQADKFYLASLVRRLELDAAWLDRAIRTIRLYWRLKHKRSAAREGKKPEEKLASNGN